jgi:hypothetical protein
MSIGRVRGGRRSERPLRSRGGIRARSAQRRNDRARTRSRACGDGRAHRARAAHSRASSARRLAHLADARVRELFKEEHGLEELVGQCGEGPRVIGVHLVLRVVDVGDLRGGKH